jgi:hypothetical protein
MRTLTMKIRLDVQILQVGVSTTVVCVYARARVRACAHEMIIVINKRHFNPSVFQFLEIACYDLFSSLLIPNGH